jgi:hypothetical protein
MSLRRRVERLEQEAPAEPGPFAHLSDEELIDRARRSRALILALYGPEKLAEAEAPFQRGRV